LQPTLIRQINLINWHRSCLSPSINQSNLYSVICRKRIRGTWLWSRVECL